MAIDERRARRRYPSDLTDAEWGLIEALVPWPKWLSNLQEPMHHPREMMDAIRYRIRTGTSWRQLPHDFPPWSTVYKCYQRWTREGVLEAIHDKLRRDVRRAAKRNEEPTAAILDSQSIKSTDVGGPCGFDAGKKGKWSKTSYPR